MRHLDTTLPLATRALLMLGLFALWAAPHARAQGYINQSAIEDVLERERVQDLDNLPEVYYNYHVLHDARGNSVLARNTFFKILGNGDLKLGQRKAKLVELLNRVLLQDLSVGDTLVVPTEFGLDFRAYAPFPRYYPGSRDLGKLFIIDKSIQAWAAYEYGQLARWGIVNTGAKTSPTPNGRYNFNWKTEHRVSSLSPPGESWDMYWVFNFHLERGIHVHQYAMPTGGPTSHGCVRLIDADAKWIYNWADPWKTSSGSTGYGSQNSRIIEPGTMVLVIGEDPVDNPHPFDFKKRYPVLRKVELPANPYDVPPGTDQQRFFDRMRASR